MSTSGAFPLYVVTAKMFNDKNPDIRVTVRETGGGVHNFRLMEKREIDFGMNDTRGAWDAMNGQGSFVGKPFPDIRLLYVIQVNPLQFIVSGNSGVKDVYGLEGKVYCPGQRGGTTEQVGMEIFKQLGVHPKLHYASYADAVESMKNERIVGFVKYNVPDSSVLDVASVMKIRILSFSKEDLDKILKNVVGLKEVVVPAGAYPGVGEFRTVKNEWGVYARKEFSAEMAYKWVKSAWENRAEIYRACSLVLKDDIPEVTLGVKIGYLHPGAIKFYRELGLTVPQHLIPPEMVEK